MDEGRKFLSIVVERLGDLFEPRLSDVYAELFTAAIEETRPSLLGRARQTSRQGATPEVPARADMVYVLSRITLGADVAVTSIVMDAAKQRYPEATIQFVGPAKNYELFAADKRVKHFPAPYARSGSLAERLEASAKLWFPLVMPSDGIVIDPDSRLSQLGLLQICPAERYFWFNSRAYGAEDDSARLPDLTARWSEEVFGVARAKPYVATYPTSGPASDITVSLGVGGNEEKRIDGSFERDLLDLLGSTSKTVLVDLGGDQIEAKRVLDAVHGTDHKNIHPVQGSFAAFAAEIARSKLYVGYDSAGGHVASACGVPVISIAKGFASPRMASRWRPKGILVRDAGGGSAEILAKIGSALESLGYLARP